MNVSGSAIYECNIKCTCDTECWNRVVQLGSRVKLAIFKTKNGCGWGVKAKQKIVKGTFIMEYLGEVNFSFFLLHVGTLYLHSKTTDISSQLILIGNLYFLIL